MIDLGWLGMLHVDGDITLTATVDLAARGGEMHAVGHGFVDELFVQLVHQGLDHTRGVSTRDVAMQPALGMRNHGHRVASAANGVAGIGKGLD